MWGTKNVLEVVVKYSTEREIIIYTEIIIFLNFYADVKGKIEWPDQ